MNIQRKTRIDMIWLGIVEVKAINNNEDLGGAAGAFVNVAYIASSHNDFIQNVNESFQANDFEVIEIEEIENEENLSIDNPDNAEKLELIREIKNGEKIAWGTFHTFDDE